jgi:hypothetical protein
MANELPEHPRRVRVLSDVDDTVKAKPVQLAFDHRGAYSGLNEGDAYPMVVGAYAAALNVESESFDGTRVAFLTARPESQSPLKAACQATRVTLKAADRMGIPRCTVLPGSLAALTKDALDFIRPSFQKRREATTILGGVDERFMNVAKAKVGVCKKYCALFPEDQFVFFGDSDVEGGKIMLNKRLVSAVFIHDVVERRLRYPEMRNDFVEFDGVHFFHLYEELVKHLKEIVYP